MLRKTLSPSQIAAVKRLRSLAKLLDESIVLPSSNYRIGIDALVGLIPVVGDLVTAAVALYIVRESARLGVPKSILAQMLVNVTIDLVGGAVPLAGDVFDAVWKANKKNVKLLEKHLQSEGLYEEGPCIDV